ncbi:MAG TPA: adenylate/guanylate cyclase domain-containing protein [Nitrososphaerales archaeon]|nr:adenylate/guanylate cyclase domain-containing protein [Nitrososphaerales archaeon]
MSQGQRRLAAIMFTDMVGYTALGQRNESLSLALVEEQRKIVRPILARHSGREVKTIGDAFMVEFSNALDAVRCAYDIQRAIREFNIGVPAENRARLRIGVHLGDVVESQGDISGDAVNLASRVEPLAEAGGVCITRQVFDQVQNKLELPMESMGAQALKNVETPVEVYRLVMPWEESKSVGQSRMDSRRIAVLPLVNMISDPSEEYFADGMTEELISAVSKVPELSVISRTSVMGYRNQTKRAAEISRELNVGTLLEGSVRKAGNRVRVAVQLIDANSDRHLWAENYDRSLEDVFAIQSDVAQNVAAALKIRLVEAQKEKIARVPTTDQEAHTLEMKGRAHMISGSEEEGMTAIGFFEQAIQRDPRFVLPYVEMAMVYSDLGFHGVITAKVASAKVQELANKAIELDESLAEAHLAMVLVHERNLEFDASRKEIKKALEINPNSLNAHQFAAVDFVSRRQFEKANAEVQWMLDLDPLSLATLNTGATVLLSGGNAERALELFQKAVSLDPRNSFARGNIGWTYVELGRYEEAVDQIKKSIEMEKRANPDAFPDLVLALTKAGRRDEAKEIVAELVRSYEQRGTDPLPVARAYAGLGETTEALRWLEKCYSEHSPGLRWVNVDINNHGFREDPRFQAFVKKLGLTE